ncbi:MAG TPA: hypothetical protein VG245_00610 [Candidatus Dormibacteraeota bacterium]|nr:hypothetical protein [Candidatus Dormibacteraeota bacterium]
MSHRKERLTLHRETLRDLAGEDLGAARGGLTIVIGVGTLLPSQCTCTGDYPSYNNYCELTVVPYVCVTRNCA